MKIYKITFVFENCQVLSIDGNYIFDLDIKDIDEHYDCIGSSFYCTRYARKFSVGILNEAEDKWDTITNIPEKNKLKRLLLNDLVAVDIWTWDGDSYESVRCKTYYVDWEGDDFTNNLMKSQSNNKGDIFLIVGKKYITNSDIEFKDFNNESYMNMIRHSRNIVSIAEYKELYN